MWKITSINNDTHAVTLTHKETGEKLSLIVPASARMSNEAKIAYLNSQTDARDTMRKVVPFRRKDKATYFLYMALGIETLTIVLLLMSRMH